MSHSKESVMWLSQIDYAIQRQISFATFFPERYFPSLFPFAPLSMLFISSMDFVKSTDNEAQVMFVFVIKKSCV